MHIVLIEPFAIACNDSKLQKQQYSDTLTFSKLSATK